LETVLIHLEIHNCMVGNGDFGWLIKVLPVEITLFGLLEGSFVALVEGKVGSKALAFKLNIKQQKGKPEIEKCEGGEAEGLKSRIGVETQPTAWEFKEAEVAFDMTKDKEGEEMMEK